MCFSLGWFEHLLIWLVVVCAAVALLQLLIGFVLPRLGLIGGDVLAVITQALRIMLWAVVLIAIIIFIFDLIACLVPGIGRW